MAPCFARFPYSGLPGIAGGNGHARNRAGLLKIIEFLKREEANHAEIPWRAVGAQTDQTTTECGFGVGGVPTCAVEAISASRIFKSRMSGTLQGAVLLLLQEYFYG